METIKLQSHIGTDGILLLQMPNEFKNTAVEVVIVVQPIASKETKSQYNSWGKLTTKESIQATINQMRQLRKEVAFDKNLIREMIEEERRF
jgi:hypothetical protein